MFVDKMTTVMAKGFDISKRGADFLMDRADTIKKATTIVVSTLSVTTAVKKLKDAFAKQEDIKIEVTKPVQQKGLDDEYSDNTLKAM